MYGCTAPAGIALRWVLKNWGRLMLVQLSPPGMVGASLPVGRDGPPHTAAARAASRTVFWSWTMFDTTIAATMIPMRRRKIIGAIRANSTMLTARSDRLRRRGCWEGERRQGTVNPRTR